MPEDRTEHVAAQWALARPDLAIAPLLLLGRVERVAADVDALLRPLFASAGLDEGAFGVLAALRRAAPQHALTPAQLVEAMLVSGGAVTKRVDRLEALGHVTRDRSTVDGRSRVVALTPRGRELTDVLITAHLRHEGELLGDLSSDQRAQLTSLLAVLASSLERQRSASGLEARPPRLGHAAVERPPTGDDPGGETADRRSSPGRPAQDRRSQGVVATPHVGGVVVVAV